ncbi:LysR family transcriptional regulator [Bradyrhizobium neotropicale]|uniref:LysR family transcriptional regulator n=1 Tax=Bradyrhizobium neotropicale TaxID=1497615 RepID=UPI001AD630F1|nr:LysR family transcriptional regulator [Bradyrhizobium neotropicale]MBO4228582.1 LysR family transcriptional regulator [Bradyrhizobium neotropicale]
MAIAPALSLDQLQVLLTVVETGSFAAAGRKLNRATSAISYAIDTLEHQLGIQLFDRGSTRRPQLTHAGEAVVAEARAVMLGADMLRARVKGLVEGLEAEVSLAIDQMVPPQQLAEILSAFHREFPTVPLRMNSETMGGVERILQSGHCGIGIGGLLHMSGDGFTSVRIDGVRIIPVARPDHPLARARSKAGAAREHLQIVLTDSGQTDTRTYSVVAGSIWRVGDLSWKRALLLAGVGWGGMPEPMVREDLQAGRLTHLRLSEFRGSQYPLQIVYKNDSPPGPAASWLIERIARDMGRTAGRTF